MRDIGRDRLPASLPRELPGSNWMLGWALPRANRTMVRFRSGRSLHHRYGARLASDQPRGGRLLTVKTASS